MVLRVPADEGDGGGLVVLAGDNGCGKTAVLEAILLVLGKDDLWPADAAPMEEQVRFGASDFTIEAKLRSDRERTSLRVDLDVLRSATLAPAFQLPHNGGGYSPTASSSWSAIKRLDANVHYFSARREPEGRSATSDPRIRREARRIVELKKRLVNTYYRSLQAGKGGKMSEGSPFVRLQRFVQRFLGEDFILDVLPSSGDPGADFEVIVRKGALPEDITSLAMARRAAVKRDDVPVIVPIDRLSSGQVALFAFAGPLIFNDAPPDVVLIDEPEQHMHLQWQRQIIGALRDLCPESQLIVATHSLEVLDSALGHERFLLAREGDPRTRLSVEDVAAE